MTQKGLGIWGFAFGYFACYVPYSALAKATSSGLLEDLGGEGLSGFSLLPISTLTSFVTMIIFLSAMGWFKHATQREVLGIKLPTPGPWTGLSGLCTAAIIGTTTLAYTFDGVSIVFMMLLMRGGVLMISPVVDFLTGRHVRWFSWLGLLLSLSALVAAWAKDRGFNLTLIATIDIALYLAAYFVRLRFMSRLAKSDDNDARLRFFVEEQIVASPTIVLGLALLALLGSGPIAEAVAAGYVLPSERGVLLEVVLIGILSQGTGIFGGLILLGKQENTYCVPVNRSSSILAGVLASYSLFFFFDKAPPSGWELAGALLIIAAIVVLTLPLLLGRKAKPS